MPPQTSLNTPQRLLTAIRDLPLPHPVRILNLCGDQERVITLADMRALLPADVSLLSGPGCAASICPEADLYQAVQLAVRERVTLLVSENMLQLPLGRHVFGPRTLQEAGSKGADVRVVAAPVEAVLAARAEPQREMVLFTAGFETLMAPFAGLVLEGLPENLTALLCGRRAEPLVDQLLDCENPGFEGLLLPGNRCAVTGTTEWEELLHRHRMPAAVAGYTSLSILTAIRAILEQICADHAGIVNCYRTMVRPEGDPLARDHLFRVFDVKDGTWRGVGRVRETAFRFRYAYDVVDADRRHPDYRDELHQDSDEMPDGCRCASVMLGRQEPSDCRQFSIACRIESPYGPCMASEDGTCYLRSGGRQVA